MARITLKPCPFCGGEAELEMLTKVKDEPMFRVHCKRCGANGPVYESSYLIESSGKIKGDLDAAPLAVNAWNKRKEVTE